MAPITQLKHYLVLKTAAGISFCLIIPICTERGNMKWSVAFVSCLVGETAAYRLRDLTDSKNEISSLHSSRMVTYHFWCSTQQIALRLT